MPPKSISNSRAKAKTNKSRKSYRRRYPSSSESDQETDPETSHSFFTLDYSTDYSSDQDSTNQTAEQDPFMAQDYATGDEPWEESDFKPGDDPFSIRDYPMYDTEENASVPKAPFNRYNEDGSLKRSWVVHNKVVYNQLQANKSAGNK